MPKLPTHRTRRRPLFFHPVPLRARQDGWSAAQQCAFLAALYLTGSVASAAQAVGMSRASAYLLRAREGAESFVHAWDHVLSAPGAGRRPKPKRDWRKVTGPALAQLAEAGLIRPILYCGKMVGIARKPDNSALLRLLRREDAQAVRLARTGSGKCPGSFANPPDHCASRATSRGRTSLDLAKRQTS